MLSGFFESGIIIYGFFQVLVALTAVVLSVKWNKIEFLAGLSFLLLYAIVNVIDEFVFTVVHGVFLDVAQFGFILIAIVFFIIGMHPSYAPKLISGMRVGNTERKNSDNESLISFLKKF
jgi:hypothetical protein